VRTHVNTALRLLIKVAVYISVLSTLKGTPLQSGGVTQGKSKYSKHSLEHQSYLVVHYFFPYMLAIIITAERLK